MSSARYNIYGVIIDIIPYSTGTGLETLSSARYNIYGVIIDIIPYSTGTGLEVCQL